MKHFYRFACLLVAVCMHAALLNAQGTASTAFAAQPVKIAVFAPLYLDEAFQGYTYKLDRNALPQHILAGLEFYNGVKMAIDSLAKEGARLQVNIYDTKQPAATLKRLFESPDFLNTGLMIASFTSVDEVKTFADVALDKNIPLISATYPNVGGVRSNPFFVLLNSSFQTHMGAVFKYLETNFARSKVVAFKRPGAIGNYIKTTLENLNQQSEKARLRFTWVDLQDNFTENEVVKNLDSTANNLVLVASPLESFGLNIVKAISSNEAYRTTAVGMPTWDGIKELDGKNCKNVQIVYSTPFTYSRSEHLEGSVIKKYRSMYYSRPSDMVFRGFETTYHFGKLLQMYGKNLINNLSHPDYKLFNDFDIVPVKVKSDSAMPDYLENKKLYFIRKQDGVVITVS